MNRCWLLLILICSFQNTAAQINGIIEGTIFDENNKPLPFASVGIGNTGTTSTDKGTFHFSNIASGSHVLSISAMGYEPFTDTIIKHASENLVLQIKMVPAVSMLNEVRVLGKTEAQKVREQPIRTLVIDTRATSTQATSLTDLMNRSAGVRIRQNGGLGSQPEISINGFQGRAIKYFKDGIPLNYLGDGYNVSSLPLEALDRIEVYKGVLPVSLGADALGGAVNLVTRKNYGKNLSAFYEAGSFHTHRFGLSGGTESKNKKWFSGVEFFYNYARNDYKARVGVVNPDTRNIELVRLPMFHNAFRNYYGEVFAGIQNVSWADELKLTVAAFDLERQQQHPALMTDAYGAIYSGQHTVAPTVHYKKSWLDNKLSVDQFASYNNLRTQRVDTLMGSYDWYGHFTPKSTIGESRLPSLSDVQEKQYTTRTNVIYRITPTQSLGFNYVFTNASRSGSDPYGPRLEGTGIDVLSLTSTYQKHVFGASLDNYWLESRLHNQAMAKFYVYKASGLQNTWFSTDVSNLDNRQQTGNYWGFADALKYRISSSSLIRTSAEYAYRLPERDELFGNNVFVVPNFELTPERSLNLNLGYQYNLRNKLFVEANGFFRRTKGLILLVPIQAPNAQFQNQQNVKGYGFDLDVSYSFLKNYRINANASWQDLRLFGISSFQDAWKNDARLRNTPYFFANAGLNTKYTGIISGEDNLKLYLNYNFLREFYLETIPKEAEPGGFLGLSGSAALNSNLVIPDQHLLNFGVTYQIASERISVGAEIKNLLNTDLFDYYRIPRPGRSLNVKLSYQLK